MFPEHWSFLDKLEHFICEALVNHRIIKLNQEKIMSALTDLQAKVSKLQSDLDAFIEANKGGASDADLTALSAQVDAMDTEVAPPTPPAA